MFYIYVCVLKNPNLLTQYYAVELLNPSLAQN